MVGKTAEGSHETWKMLEVKKMNLGGYCEETFCVRPLITEGSPVVEGVRWQGCAGEEGGGGVLKWKRVCCSGRGKGEKEEAGKERETRKEAADDK